MKDKNPSAAGPAFNIADIYYVLFRHKWKILLISLLGLAAAGATYSFWPKTYMSEAKLFIKYVVETKAPTTGEPSDISAVKNSSGRGESLLATEVEILRSRDVAMIAATNAGVVMNRTNFTVGDVLGGLVVEPLKGSRVIRVTFEHKDPNVVMPVLEELISSYRLHHLNIHREMTSMGKFLSAEAQNRLSSLNRTEEDLRQAKAKADVVSVEDARKSHNEQIGKLNQELLSLSTEMVERQVLLGALTNGLASTTTNTASSSNQLAVVPDALKTATPPTVDVQMEYRRVSSMVDSLSKREGELLMTLTGESALVKSVREQLAAALKTKLQLEDTHPGLVSIAAVRGSSSGPVDPRVALRAELVGQEARLAALQAKYLLLTNRLVEVQIKALAVQNAEARITELQRKKEMEEQQYRYFSSNLEQLRMDEALSHEVYSNIATLSKPSPAFVATTKMLKVVLGIIIGSLLLALGLPFVIEMYLDQTVKKPDDVEIKVGLPLFINMPRLQRNGKGFLPSGVPSGPLLAEHNASHEVSDNEHPVGSDASSEATQKKPSTELTPWDATHPLRPFNEALRDRLIAFFERKNMTHKPKLVAITGCAEGAGVSTVAAGLAASLSETGEGNVLLVDMNLHNGSAHHFHKGDLELGIDKALEAHGREEAKVQENLFVVSESKAAENLPGIMPKRFKSLVPRLKASDYDYIVFDMPPVSQISVTPRLAKFMDMVLMVVESEKTDKETVRKAGSLLSESNPNVGVVLNKSREYMPRRLRQPV